MPDGRHLSTVDEELLRAISHGERKAGLQPGSLGRRCELPEIDSSLARVDVHCSGHWPIPLRSCFGTYPICIADSIQYC
jgi:hypothetical protein